MPQPPDWNKYLDAGVEFVAMTRTQARQRAKELVSQGQLAQEQVAGFVDDLVDESRKRTDVLLEVVRKEIQRQVKTLGIATKDDLARLETKIAKQTQAREVERRRSRPRRAAAKKTAKKAAAKKAAKSTKKAAKKPTKKSSRRKRPRRPLPSGAGRIMRRRLDVELVRRGLVSSRTRAAEAVEEGRVTVGGAPTRSVARQVDEHEPIVVTGDPPRFVSRGGEKLDAALERFAVDVTGRAGPRRRRVDRRVHRLPAPAGGRRRSWPSTSGARQLDWSLRQDPRVILLERTNLRGPGARRDRRRSVLGGGRGPLVHLADAGRRRRWPG